MCGVKGERACKGQRSRETEEPDRSSSHSHLLPGFLLMNETQTMETDGYIKRWREKETGQMIR